MATPHRATTTVVVLELTDAGAQLLLHQLDTGTRPPLARYVVRDPEGIEDVLAVTTGWTRNT